MAQFTIYRSTDASAPVLSGASAALTTLLTAILVNGYGSKAAAGWTNPINGAAGQAAYLQGSGSNGMYLAVDDTGPGAGTFKEARTFGWKTLSAWNTGTEQFPLPATLAGGITLRKSTTADGTARSWIAFADSRTLYLFVVTGDQTTQYFSYMFGDFYTTASGDTWNTMACGRSVETNAAASSVSDNFPSVSPNATITGHFINRPYTGIAGTPAVAGKMTDNQSTSTLGISNIASAMAFPNGADGGLYMAPLRVVDTSGTNPTHRGRLRGVYAVQHTATNFSDGDTFSGTGDYAGKTFIIVKNITCVGSTTTHLAIETSATLESN